jgi:AraC-like DNA-binding protein
VISKLAVTLIGATIDAAARRVLENRAMSDVRGVLRTPPDDAWSLHRFDPGPRLAPYTVWHWIVAWDLRGREPHHQTTLPHPSTHLVVEEGGAWLYGPLRERFERTLAGRGRAVGLRFKPGGLRPLLRAPVSSIRDRRLPASTLPGLDGDALTRAVEAADELEQAVAAMEAALEPLVPPEPDPEIELAARAVSLLEEDRELNRVSDLAERLSLSVRSVQRLFADHVGLGPSWVIRRYRLHEAAARATAGGDVDWARLAITLGYYDQAHLVRDFTATVGTAPARYAAAQDQ